MLPFWFTLPLALSDAFMSADDARRQQGRLLDQLGFGPRLTASRTVHRGARCDLIAYQAGDPRQPVVLIVPAPIKAFYIWDLAARHSAVARFLEAGMQVYLIAWHRPAAGDESCGLAEYADRAIVECAEVVQRETAQLKFFVAGHSLGGTLAAIFASLHPHRVRGLLAFEAPVHFDRAAGQIEAAIASAPPPQSIGHWLGNLPGTFLDMASVYADPVTFHAEPMLDWLHSASSAQAQELHLRVRRWTLDESPMARCLFEEVAGALYAENRFAARTLRVNGRLADPRAFGAPVLGVFDPHSRIVPAVAVEALRTRTSSRDVHLVEYEPEPGVALQHVGVLVGRNAHQMLWPRVASWLHRHARGGVPA